MRNLPSVAVGSTVDPPDRRLSPVRREVGWLDTPAYITTLDDGSDAAVDLTKISRSTRCTDTGNGSPKPATPGSAPLPIAAAGMRHRMDATPQRGRNESEA
jgi:hypothetical protein